MSEWNTIYDNSDNIIGTFRHGVAWSRITGERLGEYDEDFVYDNESNVVATIGETAVVDINGDIIGHASGKDLYLNNEKVGHFIGSYSAGSAAIVLLFSEYAPSNS